MPLEYVPVLLAERFGGGLAQYRDLPADDRQELLNLLAEEARISSYFEDLAPEDEVVFPDDWDDD